MSAKATVLLFKNTGRTPESHLVVDYPTAAARADFWAQQTTVPMGLCQIEKSNSVDFTLNLDLSATANYDLIDYGSYSEPAKPTIVYFYVSKVEYLNDKVQILHCRIDTFETYFSVATKQFFPNSTRVMRKHKARWANPTTPIIDNFPEPVQAENYMSAFAPICGALTTAHLSPTRVKGVIAVYRHMSWNETTTQWTPDSSGQEVISFFVDVYGTGLTNIKINGLATYSWSYLLDTNVTFLQASKVELYTNLDAFFNVISSDDISFAINTFGGRVQQVVENDTHTLYEIILTQTKTRSSTIISSETVSPFAYTPTYPGVGMVRSAANESKLLSSQFNHKEMKIGELVFPVALEKLTANITLTQTFGLSHTAILNTSEMEKLSLPSQLKNVCLPYLVSRVNKGVFWTDTGWESWLNDFDNQRNNALIAGGINIAAGTASAVLGGPVGAMGVVTSAMGLAKSLTENLLTAGTKIDQQKRFGSVSESGDPTGYVSTLASPYNLPVLETFLLEPYYQSMLEGIFYYLGYSCNDVGEPNIHVREDFDFLQANIPYFSHDLTTGYSFNSREQEVDLRQRFADGLCIIHSDGYIANIYIADNDINRVMDLISTYNNKER